MGESGFVIARLYMPGIFCQRRDELFQPVTSPGRLWKSGGLSSTWGLCQKTVTLSSFSKDPVGKSIAKPLQNQASSLRQPFKRFFLQPSDSARPSAAMPVWKAT